VRHLRAWALGFVALFWLWIALAGEWNAYEWVAGAAAAAVAAAIGELARTRAGVSARLPLARLRDLGLALAMVFADFAILMGALARSAVQRTPVRGRFRSHPFAAGGDDPVSRGVRAWVAAVATLSPNAYVVEIDRDRVLLHDLVPNRRSERPA
jgi:multisubunit Na+/H+ antiporter MnhE subunit